MYKFFVNDKQIVENKINIIGEDVNHIKNVLRLEIEEKICVCNKETSISFLCKIIELNNERIICDVLEEIAETTETNCYIHIFQGLPKSEKLEFIIEKCTEIGVKEITPVVMKRTIVKLDEKDKVKKTIRWQKIAEVAAKQSGRNQIPKINNIIPIKNICKLVEEYDLILVAYEKEENTTLKQVLKKIKQENKENLKIAVVIGPEGGLEETEVEFLKQNGASVVTLGNRILRTETVALNLLSIIMYELEN